MVSIEPLLDYILVTKYKGSFFYDVMYFFLYSYLPTSIIVPVLRHTFRKCGEP